MTGTLGQDSEPGFPDLRENAPPVSADHLTPLLFLGEHLGKYPARVAFGDIVTLLGA